MTKEIEREFRCLTPQEIGKAVTMMRNLASMKQFTLAHEAGITERTVQRIEGGEKVSEESLRRIAKALRMDEKSFIGPRHVLSEEEAVRTAKKRLQDLMVIEAHRFACLKDAEAVLGTDGMIIDDHFITEEAADDSARFKDLLRDYNDVYGVMRSHEEKLDACRALLIAAKSLDLRGYSITYGTYTSQDDYRLSSMVFARKADENGCAIKQMIVPSRFTELAWSSL